MNKFRKILLILILLIIIINLSFSNEPERNLKPAWPAIFFTIFLGFGTGHFYLEDENAMRFLVGNIVGLGINVAGVVMIWDTLYSLVYNDINTNPFDSIDQVMTGYVTIGVGLIISTIVDIWEIIDVFSAIRRQSQAGKVSNFSTEINIQPDSISFGLLYKY